MRCAKYRRDEHGSYPSLNSLSGKLLLKNIAQRCKKRLLDIEKEECIHLNSRCSGKYQICLVPDSSEAKLHNLKKELEYVKSARSGGSVQSLLHLWRRKNQIENQIRDLENQPKQKQHSTICVHKFLYLIIRGNIPQNHVLTKKCNSKLCINPFHYDLVPKSQIRGKKKGAKLRAEDIQYIRENAKPNGLKMTQKELSQRFACTQSTISNVKHGKFYNWVDTFK